MANWSILTWARTGEDARRRGDGVWERIYSPSSPFFAKATKGTSSPREKDNSEASLSARGEDERSEGEGALPLRLAPVVLAFLSTLTDERR